ncbi:tRNA (adenosine(37)-N6)-threonylcarbamoyltransferase complex transferase subunit TsaD [Candidatus Uhrbacteria bacterium RIFCSPHIGHO2_12_FULL_60_25]|uniref:tRNA N6-adenosine threonylcarbamoyltransferase n=1 Tax=Candidatus Uhrbacteria bacterium RIFCSPHIGHO2_12_FULL_60_25 TaxID=1802399 RepID=A0A1F7UKZ0_9BACT|nr:MAG: tRNA (adenosine(37)-N6)-threonylcarbamoyltransferase complex transferase subunit TsaD [Candidatus Uhrbacteria bacterium RIFCSPHIGHO2_12_FULL_60_25]
MKKLIRILGLETSCDETSVALLDVGVRGETVRLVKHVISSQIDIHAKYGGVVPEVAARTHVAEVVSLLTSVLGRRPLEAKGRATAFDAIAVTRGPGLATALRVGIQAAQTLAWITGKPVIGVNHLEGHLASAWLLPENRRRWTFPALALLVSGGHTELVVMRDYCRYDVIGSTRDDAAGEAFDKSAKLLGLGYPGGPVISRFALKGRDDAYKLPRPMLHDASLDMSFSGLKTAIRREVEIGNREPFGFAQGRLGTGNRSINDLCASIEAAIVAVLVAKTIRAAKQTKAKTVLLVGGVSANTRLREDLTRAVRRELPKVAMLKTPVKYATDNAAMIAAAGAWRLLRGETHDWKKLDAEPELSL